jgi:curved DNA-binding protein CbpA
MKDYYQTLGVSRFASAADIRTAYRKLVRELHPDKNPDPQAHELIREVNEAYEVLSNDTKRQAYDNRFNYPELEIEINEPVVVHRDPAYRRRAKPATSARPAVDGQLELKKRIVAKTHFFFFAGTLLSVFLSFDYFLEPVASTETIVGFRSENFRRSYQDYLLTSSGGELKIAYEDRISLRQGQQIVIYSSRLLTIQRKAVVPAEDPIILTNLATLYGNFLFVPVMLTISSVLGLVAARFSGVEFRLNLLIANAFLLIFTLVLIIIH